MGFGDFMAGISKDLDEFGKNQLSPTLGEVSKGLITLVNINLDLPWVSLVKLSMCSVKKSQVSPALAKSEKVSTSLVRTLLDRHWVE
jgi:hypothetical protein